MPSKANVFYIKSYLNGLCLDIEGSSRDAGAKVLMYTQKTLDEGADNQLWYMDPHTLTIRNVQDDYCLEVDDSCGRVVPYEAGNTNQTWATVGQFLVNLDDNKCLDVVGASHDECADICGWERHGEVNQRWYFENVPRRHFLIVSRMNEDKCLDIEGGDEGEGTALILYDKHGGDNQQWFCGREGLIKSKLTGYVLDASDGDIKMRNQQPHSYDQGFMFTNGRIMNLHKKDQVLDVKGNDDGNGTGICQWEYHGGDNQHWRLEYVN